MKTKENNASAQEFIDNLKNERRRQDSLVVLKMMEAVTGKEPKMWGPSIIGFDKSSYKLANGRTEEICTIGFSPRVQSLSFYGTTKFKGSEKLFEKLGKHKMGAGGCLYINKLDDVDLNVLEKIIDEAYRHNKENKNDGC